MIYLQTQDPSGWTTYAFFGAMLLVFYFFMIRPQNKKRKKNGRDEKQPKERR